MALARMKMCFLRTTNNVSRKFGWFP